MHQGQVQKYSKTPSSYIGLFLPPFVLLNCRISRRSPSRAAPAASSRTALLIAAAAIIDLRPSKHAAALRKRGAWVDALCTHGDAPETVWHLISFSVKVLEEIKKKQH